MVFPSISAARNQKNRANQANQAYRPKKNWRLKNIIIISTSSSIIILAISNEAASLFPWKIEEIFSMKSSVRKKTKAIVPLYKIMIIIVAYNSSLIRKIRTAIVLKKVETRAHIYGSSSSNCVVNPNNWIPLTTQGEVLACKRLITTTS